MREEETRVRFFIEGKYKHTDRVAFRSGIHQDFIEEARKRKKLYDTSPTRQDTEHYIIEQTVKTTVEERVVE